MRILVCFLTFLLSFCNSNFLFSQRASERVYFHVNVKTFYGYYSGNKNHSGKLSFLPSFSISFLPEFRFSRKSSLLLGAEWFTHGSTFSSYYFQKGIPAIYDKNFNFWYALRWNEFVVPIFFRSIFEGKMKDRHKYFLDLGPAVRFVFPAICSVNDVDGNEVLNSKVVTPFNPSAKNNALGMFFQCVYGMEFFKDDQRSAFSFSLMIKYPTSRFLFQEEFTASGLFISQFHAGVGCGIRF